MLKLIEKGRRILKGDEKPLLLEPANEKPAPKPLATKAFADSVDHDLFEELRNLHGELARERGVPAYIIFNNATLPDIAIRRASTASALLLVSGIGMKKLELYGKRILEIIRRHSAKKKQK